jgi:uncharacterized protein (DUF2062 family)
MPLHHACGECARFSNVVSHEFLTCPVRLGLNWDQGGIMTFTAGAILDSPSHFMQVLECIKASSEIWLAYITPVVIGSLQASAIQNPEDER